MGFLLWIFRIFVTVIVVLIVAIIVHFVWNYLMSILRGPELDIAFVTLITAIVSVGTGNFIFTLTLPTFQKKEPS